MYCGSCNKEFNPNEPQHKKYGLYNECGFCGKLTDKKRKVRRNLGVQGGEGVNKSANISIIRNPDRNMQRRVRAQNNSVFNANLPFSRKVDSADSKEQRDLNVERKTDVKYNKQPGPKEYTLRRKEEK